MFPRTIENRLKIGRNVPILRHQSARIEPCRMLCAAISHIINTEMMKNGSAGSRSMRIRKTITARTESKDVFGHKAVFSMSSHNHKADTAEKTLCSKETSCSRN